MASKSWNDLEALQRMKGSAVPRVKDNRRYKALKAARNQLRENIRNADKRSQADTSKPELTGMFNNVWGF